MGGRSWLLSMTGWAHNRRVNKLDVRRARATVGRIGVLAVVSVMVVLAQFTAPSYGASGGPSIVVTPNSGLLVEWFCSPAGATGVTPAGTPMVCKTSPTDSRLRWRSA